MIGCEALTNFLNLSIPAIKYSPTIQGERRREPKTPVRSGRVILRRLSRWPASDIALCRSASASCSWPFFAFRAAFMAASGPGRILWHTAARSQYLHQATISYKMQLLDAQLKSTHAHGSAFWCSIALMMNTEEQVGICEKEARPLLLLLFMTVKREGGFLPFRTASLALAVAPMACREARVLAMAWCATLRTYNNH